MTFRALLVIASALFSVACFADEANGSSSNDAFVLGRVFTTPAERAMLDQKRKYQLTDNGEISQVDAEKKSVQKHLNPVGYIISSSGVASKWIDGDFQQVDDFGNLEALRFPGGISVTKHATATEKQNEESNPEIANKTDTEIQVTPGRVGENERNQ